MPVQKFKNSKFLIVVAGPTAVGKTALCLKLAQHLGTVILSADSRQLYKEMDIGTAKPTANELAQVKHFFINSHNLDQAYNSGAFESDVLALLDELFKIKDYVILTGGSGLYIRAVCEGLDQMPEISPGLRDRLAVTLAQEGLSPLLAALKELDPQYYDQVDHNNPQRIIRALEVCYSAGQPYSSFRGQTTAPRPFKIIKIGLNRHREDLYRRIDDRMDQMLGAGLEAEARSLFSYRHHNALQTVGYQEIFDYLEGRQDWDETKRLLKRNSRRYAKRQLTWFTRDTDFKWFHPEDWDNILTFITESLGRVK